MEETEREDFEPVIEEIEELEVAEATLVSQRSHRHGVAVIVE